MKKWLPKLLVVCMFLSMLATMPLQVYAQEAYAKEIPLEGEKENDPQDANTVDENAADAVTDYIYGADTVTDYIYSTGASIITASTVTVSRAGVVNWTGPYPIVGDREFYIEVLGKGLLDSAHPLEAEVFIFDDPDYIKVASQTDWRYLGKTDRGEERYIFKMAMDGDETLSSLENYYIDVKDHEDNYLFPTRSYSFFNVWSSGTAYFENLSVSEISSTVEKVNIYFEAYEFAPGQSKNDVDVELWQYEGMNWDGPWGEGIFMGTMGKETMRVEEIKGAGYRIAGIIPIQGTLTGGKKLFLKTTAKLSDGTRASAYSFVPIKVLKGTTPTAEPPRIKNGMGGEQGQGHEPGSEVPGDPAYIIDNSTNILKFEVLGTLMAEPEKINAQLKDGETVIGSLRAGSVAVSSSAHGIDTISGIVDITGPVPAEGASLVIFYDNTPVSSAIIKRSEAVGVSQVWYGENSYHFDEVYQLPLNGKIDLWLEGTLNILPSHITANLVDDSQTKIPLRVSAQSKDNGITLTLTPETAVEGKYTLELRYLNSPFMQIYYDPYSKELVETGSEIADGVNALCFEFLDEEVLKKITNDHGDLLITGIGFDDATTYRACLIKRTGAALNSSPFTAAAVFISETELKIVKNDLESFPRGWYTVYLTADNEQIKGFADVSLLSEDDNGPAIILPTATINNDAKYTTQPNVTLNLSAGSFTQVRFAETEAGLLEAVWQDISSEIPYTLSEGFGTKTIFFSFKTDAGEMYSLSDSILYRGTALENMLEYGVANAKLLENNTTYLNKDRNYTLFIKSYQLNLTGKVEFYDVNNTLIHTEELKRTASNNGVHTYSKSVKMGVGLENAVALNFYLEDNEGFISVGETMPVIVSNEAYISASNTIFKTKNYHQLYVENDSEVQYVLSGTPNFHARAKLTYLNAAGETKSIDYHLTFNGISSYRHTAALPGEARKIVHVEYSITDPNVGENKAIKTEEKNLDVTGSVNFVGLANESGDYNEKTITLFDSLSWFSLSQVIRDNQTSFSFGGLKPNADYQYRVGDSAHTYALGSITLDPGQKKVENLSTAKLPAKVRFNVSGGSGHPRIAYRIKDSYYDRYVESGKELEGFFVGQELTYTVLLSDNDAQVYQIPDEKDIIITEKVHTVDITLDKLPKIKVSGTITDEKISGRNLEGCVISVWQTVTNGSRNIDYNNTAVTDEEGKYEIELYRDAYVAMNISKNGYVNKILEFSSAEDLVQNETLTYNQQNKISINLFTRPLVGQGEELDTSTLLGLDNNKISRVTVKKANGTDIYAYYIWYDSSIQIYDKNVSPQEKVRVYFEFYNDMLPEQDFYEITLDEYLNGKVDAVAVKGGEVTANVITGGDNPPSSYMLLYDQSGKQAAVITGTGSLSSEFHDLKDGQYTAILLKGYELKKVQNLKLLEAFLLLDLEENNHYVKKTLTIERGRRTNLGDIEIPELVFDDNLSFTETSIKTKYTPNSSTGEILVMANFKTDSSQNDGEITLEVINIRTSATLKSNEVYYDGEGYAGNYITPRDKKNIDGMLYFTLIPPDMEQTTLTIVLTYRVDGKVRQESFGVENIDAPKVTIIPPSEVFLGERAKNVLVRGIGLPDSTIEIYDNDILIGETKVPSGKTNYQTTVALSFPDYATGHMMYAKMIGPDGESSMSSLKMCEIIDPQMAAYTSHFEFDNGWGRKFTNNDPNESNYPLTFSYNPYAVTKVSFRINNLLKEQISYAGLVSRNDGVDTMFEAAHKKDVDEGNVKYSEWELERVLGYLGDLSVYYALAFDEPLAPISGSKPIDFAEAVKEPHVDPAALPGVIRNNLDNRTITEDPNHLEVVVPVADGSSVKVTGDFSEGHTISEEALKAQGYRKFETVQGYYWARETMAESGNTLTYRKTMYLSPALTAILKSGTVLRSMALKSTAMMNASSTADDVLSKADYAGYVYNVGEIINDTSANPANLGKVGTGMQVLGGAVLAGQVLLGPTSKDHNTLYSEAAKIEDPLVRSRLGDEIREYDRARRSAHKVNTLFGGVSYGAGFAGPVGKGLSYIVSTGGMVFGQKTGAELDIWWDAVMRDIQNEITLQERRKQQKEKPKPGKKDEQKKPKWKIDPSGYVFEAIDSHRVEGITASVLLKNEMDDQFYFWNEAEEWEEINPDTTDQDGKYGWDVPAGDWKVRFEGAGYQTSETKGMIVPPVHDQVNIGLLSTKAPEVLGVALDSTGLEVEFDLFMQGETIYDPARHTENITVVDSDNMVVPCERVDFIIAADNDSYKSGGLYQTSVIDADKFVKRIRFVPDEDLYPGGFKLFKDDGETPETYKVTLNTNMQSYAGVHLEANYEGPEMTVDQRQKAAPPQADIPSGGYSSAQRVTITTDTTGATIYYTTDGTTPTALSRVYQEPFTVTKTSVIKLMTSKVGMDDSDVTVLNYAIRPEIGNVVATPTANIPSGTYNKKQYITLATTTDGATIHYTTDGTLPTTDSTIYVSPIMIESTKTIKAIAVKQGYTNSGVATFNYIIESNSTPGGSGSNSSNSSKETVIKETVPEAFDNQFNDISNYVWAQEAIIYLAEQGIIKGISEECFAPSSQIKRADFIALMVRLFGITVDVKENFSDVAPDKYYYNEIGIAKELGFVDGMGNNQFKPEASITRQDMFVIADRIMKTQGMLTDDEDVKILEKFSDHTLISPYAKQSMADLVSKGFILGSNNRLNPLNHTTRAETAVFIYRISQRMISKQE